MTMLGATLITQRHPALPAPSARGEAGALVTRGGPRGRLPGVFLNTLWEEAGMEGLPSHGGRSLEWQ